MFNIMKKMSEEQKEIYNKYKYEFPFKIVEFINELGIIVTKAQMPSYISGAIRKEKDVYRIYINDSHASTRLRFTLAHELGHYFCDRDYLNSNEIIDLSKSERDKTLFRKDIFDESPEMREMDINANRFAAELLMPEDEFMDQWIRETPIQKIAEFFKVSETAVMIRASNLTGEIF